jgi:hypothetical protein
MAAKDATSCETPHRLNNRESVSSPKQGKMAEADEDMEVDAGAAEEEDTTDAGAKKDRRRFEIKKVCPCEERPACLCLFASLGLFGCLSAHLFCAVERRRAMGLG